MRSPRLTSPGIARLGMALVVAAFALSGCSDPGQVPDETAKNAPPKPPKSVEEIARKSGRPIPKSIKDRS